MGRKQNAPCRDPRSWQGAYFCKRGGRSSLRIHLRQSGVAAQCAVLLHTGAAVSVGESQVLFQLRFAQLGQCGGIHAVPGHLPEEGADKSIAGAGGIHRFDGGAGRKSLGAAGKGISAVAAAGVYYKLNIANK